MPDINVLRRRRPRWPVFLLVVVLLLAVGGLLYQIPSIQRRVNWEMDKAQMYLMGVFDPVKPIPTALGQVEPIQSQLATLTPTPTLTPATSTPTPQQSPTPTLSPTPTQTPTPIPNQVLLPAPQHDVQLINSCGPATLAHYLRFYSWNGNQSKIIEVVQSKPEDRNVNVEELVYYVRNFAGWLKAEFRVGGDLALLRRFIAAGIPVMIETGTTLDQDYWPGDDRWAGHYLLMIGYDESKNTFIAHDAWRGPHRVMTNDEVEQTWQPFNHVYILVYPPDKEPTVKALLGTDWDPQANRKHALEDALARTKSEPGNAFAWFNYGSNLLFFDRFTEAATAYDKARELNLPQRFLRYQFGPFIAYFHGNRISDLMALADYGLRMSPTSEETMLWKAWGFYRQGKKDDALKLLEKALEINPRYEDAKYAIGFIQKN